MTIRLITGDTREVIKYIEENSIDLIITSPPYADVKSYGKKVNIFHPNQYVDWLLPFFDEFYRVLKPSGNFILNIDDRCYRKKRHIYVFDLVVRAERETKLLFYDYYIWYKRGGVLPNGGPKRLNHNTEFLLHFVKEINNFKFYMDRVREEYDEITKKRVKSSVKSYSVDKNGVRIVRDERMWKLNPKGKTPNNVFLFPTNADNRKWKHPAPFHTSLPEWFIRALTDEGDTVLDPFVGSGTTAEVSVRMKRNFIGIDKNLEYIKMSKERLEETSKLKPRYNNDLSYFFG